MAKSSKPRKKKSNTTNSEKYKSIKHVQSIMKDFVAGSCQYRSDATVTYKNGIKLDKPTYNQALAIKTVRFEWKILLGVLGRLPNGQMKALTKVVYSDKEYLLEDLHKEVIEQLKDMFDNQFEKQYRLTTFWVATPNFEADNDTLALQAFSMLHDYRVPDNMATDYEHDVKGLENVSRNYCATNYWLTNLDWEEIVEKEIPIDE